MARLRTARLTNNDLLSSFATAVGEFETELCDIFGFTPDETVTASALSLDNSGRITKDVLLRYFAEDTPTGTPLGNRGYGGGHVFTNSSSSTSVMLSFEGLSGSPTLNVRSDSTLGIEPIQSGIPVFGINMSTGALTGSTTQNTVNKVLIPASAGAGSDAYYNAQGIFATPGALPFAGVAAVCGSGGTVPASDTIDLVWTAEEYDVGGYLAIPAQITVPTGGDGKYLVTAHMFHTGTEEPYSYDVSIIKNRLTQQVVAHLEQTTGGNVGGIVNLITTCSLAATDKIDFEITNNNSSGFVVFSGRLSMFRFGT